jgi:flagellar basal-body rod modification protein FlgD
MSIEAIGAGASATASSNALGLQDFMKILLTQLMYQDPLKPLDNQEFMAQMAQFTSLEQTQRLNDKVQQMIQNQAALQSVGLIGRTVEVSTETGRASGTVTALSVQGDAPVFTLALPGGALLSDVGLSRLIAIR